MDGKANRGKYRWTKKEYKCFINAQGGTNITVARIQSNPNVMLKVINEESKSCRMEDKPAVRKALF